MYALRPVHGPQALGIPIHSYEANIQGLRCITMLANSFLTVFGQVHVVALANVG